jgi:hypothetical protein
VSPSGSEAPDVAVTSLADLAHTVRNALMIIWGRTGMLQRAVAKDARLSAAQTAPLLRDLAAIDTAVSALVMVIDTLDDERIGATPAASSAPPPQYPMIVASPWAPPIRSCSNMA